MRAAALVLVLIVGCRTQRDPADFAERYRQARALLNAGELERIGEISQRAAHEARRSGSAGWASAFLVLDGEALAFQGKREEAIRKLTATEAPAARPDVFARRNATLAMEICIQAANGKAPVASDLFRRAAVLLEESERAAAQAGPEVQGDFEMRRASCLIDQNQLTGAEQALRGVLDLAQANHLRFLEGSALVTLTYVRLRSGHYEEGVGYSKESLAIAREIGSDRLLVKSLGNLGLCYSRLGDYDNALEYLKQAESLAPKRQFRDDLSTVFQNSGNLYYLLHDYDGAAAYYRRALQLADDRLSRAQLTANLGAVAVERGDFEAAERYGSEALKLKRELGEPRSIIRSEELNARILFGKGDLAASEVEFRRLAAPDSPEDVIWESHAGLAELYRKQSRKVEAEREYRAAISVIENSRDALKLDDSKITFQSGLSRLYDNYITFLAGSGRPREALSAADRSRAATLAQRTEQDSPRTAGELPLNAPALAKTAHAVLLSYWLAPEASFLWVATPSRVEQFTLPGQAEIERRVDAYQRIVEKPRDALREAGQQGIELWRMLIGPAEQLISPGARVLIVPDRGLHRLNFETLVSPAPIPHYWIEDVTITEAPALRAVQTKPPSLARDSILLMGDPAAADRDFPPLRYSADEIAGIERLYPAADRVVLTGVNATPAAYLDSTPRRFRFIHFAAHATANKVRPLDSAVVFARGAGEYKLFARDVLTAPLDAELVTISACRSAGTRAYAGEGLVGFAWAFLSAGARNVIAGLWNVEDASTAELMMQLHHELRLGRSPADALRNSKLALLHSGATYRRPFYWAPFLLYTRGI